MQRNKITKTIEKNKKKRNKEEKENKNRTTMHKKKIN